MLHIFRIQKVILSAHPRLDEKDMASFDLTSIVLIAPVQFFLPRSIVTFIMRSI